MTKYILKKNFIIIYKLNLGIFHQKIKKLKIFEDDLNKGRIKKLSFTNLY